MPIHNADIAAILDEIADPPHQASLSGSGHTEVGVAPFPWTGWRLNLKRCVAGILFVLQSGIPWEMLPKEMGCGSGMSCWRRLRAWQEAGVWDRLHEVLLARLRAADRIDWSRVIVDSSSIRAVGAGQKQDRIPPIALDQAPSTTSSPTRRASHSR